MSILINKHSQVLMQGMTGKEGQRALSWMRAFGTRVIAGVTPGKGGQKIEGIPVYNSVLDALTEHPEINVSSIYVPPQFARSATEESIQAGIPLIHIIAEGIPTQDAAAIIEQAQTAEVRLVGPSSIGILSPGKGSIGSIGGGRLEQYIPVTNQPGVAIISKSGGMANTIATMLTYAGIPQSTVIGIGGDRFVGTTFAELLPDLAADNETAAVVIIGEIGGAYEELLAQAITDQGFTKPLIAFISGVFAETLPQGVAFGHAGAIVSKSEGTRSGKIAALKKAGALIAKTPSEIIGLLEEHYA